MLKKYKWVKIGLIFLGIILAFMLLARIITLEDDWICKDGKWVKHGNPTSEMPSTTCPN